MDPEVIRPTGPNLRQSPVTKAADAGSMTAGIGRLQVDPITEVKIEVYTAHIAHMRILSIGHIDAVPILVRGVPVSREAAITPCLRLRNTPRACHHEQRCAQDQRERSDPRTFCFDEHDDLPEIGHGIGSLTGETTFVSKLVKDRARAR